jgi:hypothetical protein
MLLMELMVIIYFMVFDGDSMTEEKECWRKINSHCLCSSVVHTECNVKVVYDVHIPTNCFMLRKCHSKGIIFLFVF